MVEGIHIRLARERDLPRVVEISNWAAAHTAANFATEPEPLEEWLALFRRTSHVHPWLVAETADGSVAGFAKSSQHKPRQAYAWSAEVSVYIDPAFHARGVGGALYAALIPQLRAQGYVTVLAGIVVGHAASERLHAKLGFRRVATFERVGWKLGAFHDVGYWQLHLRPADAAPSPLRGVLEVLPASLRE